MHYYLKYSVKFYVGKNLYQEYSHKCMILWKYYVYPMSSVFIENFAG